MHNMTVTQVITALQTLANAEASLRLAGNAGEERYREVSESFLAATHFYTSMNFVNQVMFRKPHLAYVFLHMLSTARLPARKPARGIQVT